MGEEWQCGGRCRGRSGVGLNSLGVVICGVVRKLSMVSKFTCPAKETRAISGCMIMPSIAFC